MTGEHPDFGPEVQQLVRTLLVMLEPLIRAGAAFASSTDVEPGRCQQAWCPVCAVAATVSGEQHPLAGIVAEHGAALLTMLRSVATAQDGAPPPAGGAPTDGVRDPSPTPGRYQPISVTIHE